MLLKKLVLSKSQMINTSFCLVNNQKVLLLQKKNGETKYLVLPFSLIIKKEENFLSLSVNDIKNENLLLNFFKIVSKFYKNFDKSFTKKLILKGLGFKISQAENGSFNLLRFKLGFSHLIDYQIPSKKIKVILKKNTLILKSNDSTFLGNFCKKIKALKKPNAYNGKGFWYKKDSVILKTFKKK